jgi:hypothetical protein
MSEQGSEQEFVHEPSTPGPFAPANLLTPKATAIAGFTFAVLSMLAQSTWSTALTTLFWGSSYSPGTVPNVMAVWGIGCLVVAGLGAWLAHHTLRVADQAWEAQLARAAVIVAALGGILAVLTIIGGLVHGV